MYVTRYRITYEISAGDGMSRAGYFRRYSPGFLTAQNGTHKAELYHARHHISMGHMAGVIHPESFRIMLEALITSKTRVLLLLKFFSNSQTSGYLRGLAEEFGESTNAVRLELNRLAGAELLTAENNGNKRYYRANKAHPLYPELKSLTRKYLGLDRIENLISRLGSVELALITGDYARGRDTGIIDVVIVGRVDEEFLRGLVKKAETVIHRKIRTLLIRPEEYRQFSARFTDEKALILWKG